MVVDKQMSLQVFQKHPADAIRESFGLMGFRQRQDGDWPEDPAMVVAVCSCGVAVAVAGVVVAAGGGGSLEFSTDCPKMVVAKDPNQHFQPQEPQIAEICSTDLRLGLASLSKRSPWSIVECVSGVIPAEEDGPEVRWRSPSYEKAPKR